MGHKCTTPLKIVLRWLSDENQKRSKKVMLCARVGKGGDEVRRGAVLDKNASGSPPRRPLQTDTPFLALFSMDIFRQTNCPRDRVRGEGGSKF